MHYIVHNNELVEMFYEHNLFIDKYKRIGLRVLRMTILHTVPGILGTCLESINTVDPLLSII